MPNNLTTVAQTLLEKIKDTNVAEHKPSDKRTTQLNYELMYKMLESEVEKHILENQGNAVVDEFKQKIITKFSSLIQQLND